jgi:N-methylhydantoinase A
MRYVGQSFDITVSLDGDARADDGTCLREAFHRSYADVYGYTDEAADLEVVNIRLTITGRTPKPAVPDAQGHGHSVDAQPHGQREIRWNRRAETANVYERERLEPGMRFDGPAIVVQYDTTVFVPDGFAVEIDAHRNLVGIAMPKAAREEA